MAGAFRAFCGPAGFSGWGALLPYSDLFVSVVYLLTLWSQVFSVATFSFLSRGLAVPRNPGWPWSHNFLWPPECWDCWCAHLPGHERASLSRSLWMCFSLSQSKRCLANSPFSCDSDSAGWLFLWTSSFIHCGHNHSSVFRWVWDPCLQLWIAAGFTCTNTIQNVRGLLFMP